MINGILGRKVGMTQVFDESGEAIPVTVIEAGPCTVVQIKTTERDGYNAVQIGFFDRKDSKFNKPKLGHFEKANVEPKRYLKELRVDVPDDISVGSAIDSSTFSVGDLVDVTGVSKGKGFAGVVKRWGFAGGRKSHGGEQDHRRPGSIGQSAQPSRVFKGQKMPGRMGNKKATVQNLQVVKADPERNLLLVKGAVPGSRNGLLVIRRAVKSVV
ncbi:MAG: 50S ribosomal protein L3 [Candidatus Poribacteria bacterium]|jgi:large subunit ribosomal protein L3|nr:50S ribosomal protein L3 [Candidatus Poribacteria bacterium]